MSNFQFAILRSLKKPEPRKGSIIVAKPKTQNSLNPRKGFIIFKYSDFWLYNGCRGLDAIS